MSDRHLPGCPLVQVYQHGQQLMHSRLRVVPEAALGPQHAGWQAQQQEQLELQYQQQYQQQRRQQQQLLQQQALAEAFPDINPTLPDWDESPGVAVGAAGGGSREPMGAAQQQAWWKLQWDQAQQQGYHPGSAPGPHKQLPELPPLARTAARAGVPGTYGASLAQHQQRQQHGALWQRQGQERDEFGVSLQPSLSTDDESDIVGPAADAMLPGAGQVAPRVQQMHQLLMPGPGQEAPGAAAFGAAAATPPSEALLGTRKRDFWVPRMSRPVASRQLARGAGRVLAAQPAAG